MSVLEKIRAMERKNDETAGRELMRLSAATSCSVSLAYLKKLRVVAGQPLFDRSRGTKARADRSLNASRVSVAVEEQKI